MNLFQQTRPKDIKKSSFNLSHQRIMSLNFGAITPILCREVLPGDKWSLQQEHLLKFAPLVSPVMHNMDVYTHYFFVPNRLVWTEWEDFISGQQLDEKGQIIEPIHPHFTLGGLISGNLGTQSTKGSIFDYLGYPTYDNGYGDTRHIAKEAAYLPISSLPLRAFSLIWNEYYRDQDLEEPLKFPTSSGFDDLGPENVLYDILDRFTKGVPPASYEKDYIMSARPWAQKGATVMLNNSTDPYISVNETRRAFALQKWLERTARGGSRYIEQLFSHFAVTSSNKALQRPQYLGGSKNNVMIGENMQTSETTSNSPQANRAGFANAYNDSHIFSQEFEEHGLLIGAMFIRPKLVYINPLDRQLLKVDKFSYFWPEFETIGEQEVLRAETSINCGFGGGRPAETYGYQSRYSEYKSIRSTVHGDMRDNLKHWHLAIHASDHLSHATIHTKDFQRIFAVTDDHSNNIYAQIAFEIIADRPLSYLVEPGNIDH